jgi:hypothetical protein
VQTAGGNDYDYAESVQQTADGGYVVTGYTKSYGAGDKDILFLKYNSAGDLEWAKTTGGTGEDYAKLLQQTTDGGYVIAGYTRSYSAGSSDIFLLKYDSLGHQTTMQCIDCRQFRQPIPLTLGVAVEDDIQQYYWQDYAGDISAGNSLLVEVTPTFPPL